MSSKNVKLECSCREVQGQLTNIDPSKAFHVHCLCSDCQSVAVYLKNEDKILDAHGGSELYQTYPAYVKITKGIDKLQTVQVKENGIYRWHTSCCKMPIANIMNSHRIPFAGVSVKFMKFDSDQEKLETLGPVIMKAFGKSARGEMPKDAYETFPKSFMFKIMKFMFIGFIKGLSSPSPFYSNKKPIVDAKILN